MSAENIYIEWFHDGQTFGVTRDPDAAAHMWHRKQYRFRLSTLPNIIYDPDDWQGKAAIENLYCIRIRPAVF
jgi:hypothetical protein